MASPSSSGSCQSGCNGERPGACNVTLLPSKPLAVSNDTTDSSFPFPPLKPTGSASNNYLPIQVVVCQLAILSGLAGGEIVPPLRGYRFNMPSVPGLKSAATALGAPTPTRSGSDFSLQLQVVACVCLRLGQPRAHARGQDMSPLRGSGAFDAGDPGLTPGATKCRPSGAPDTSRGKRMAATVTT